MTSFSGGRLLVITAAVAVVAAVVVGVVVLGSPGVAREKKLDAVRVADLAAIEGLISSYARQHKSLPPDLAALNREPGYLVPRKDPESAMPYEYEILGEDTYRLCAQFRKPSSRDLPENVYSLENTWVHGAGQQCFNRHADAARAASP
jgi:hypothetical protein